MLICSNTMLWPWRWFCLVLFVTTPGWQFSLNNTCVGRRVLHLRTSFLKMEAVCCTKCRHASIKVQDNLFIVKHNLLPVNKTIILIIIVLVLIQNMLHVSALFEPSSGIHFKNYCFSVLSYCFWAIALGIPFALQIIIIVCMVLGAHCCS